MATKSERTWRTQCVNYLAWGREKLTREQAVRDAEMKHSGDGRPTVDEANRVVYYHAGICL